MQRCIAVVAAEKAHGIKPRVRHQHEAVVDHAPIEPRIDQAGKIPLMRPPRGVANETRGDDGRVEIAACGCPGLTVIALVPGRTAAAAAA